MRRVSSAAVLALCAGSALAQTATMPPHATGFTGATRGYWFTAPVSFRITGVQALQLPGGANGFMNWAVVKFDNNTPPPVFSATTNAFTQLGLGLGQPSGSYSPVSIDVLAGEVIGVYGNTVATPSATTGVNSYTAASPQGTITILGNAVPITRSGMQFHLGTPTSPQGMHDVWTELASSAVSRVEFTYVPLSGPSGACCLPSGACVVSTATGCAGQGGVYQGDGSTCGTVICPQPPTGACCFFASCSVLTQAACTAQGGAYQGNSTACGSCPAVPPVFFSNCGISTGATTLSGQASPSGGVWSETARDETDPTTANTTAGFGGTGALRLADDFVVPAGGMNVAYVRAYAYLTGAATPGVTAANIQIWNGNPSTGGTVIFGDTTTNRLANNSFSNIYRCFNTVTPPTCGGAATVPDANRRLQYVYLTVNQFLPAGTYWIDINYTGASFSPPSVQADAIGRQCDPNNSNAIQFNGAWVALADAGQGCVLTPVNQDLFFDVLGTAPSTGPACYANCDSSTNQPCLNVQDFGCFLNAFAAGQSYANCDNSTNAPVLNVQDFGCFLNAFAAGCSSCV